MGWGEKLWRQAHGSGKRTNGDGCWVGMGGTEENEGNEVSNEKRRWKKTRQKCCQSCWILESSLRSMLRDAVSQGTQRLSLVWKMIWFCQRADVLRYPGCQGLSISHLGPHPLLPSTTWSCFLWHGYDVHSTYHAQMRCRVDAAPPDTLLRLQLYGVMAATLTAQWGAKRSLWCLKLKSLPCELKSQTLQLRALTGQYPLCARHLTCTEHWATIA